MKKMVTLFLLVCVCFALHGCFHEHTPQQMPSISMNAHWYACETCGKKMEVQEHDFGEDGACRVCTAIITQDQYGEAEAVAYDEHENEILHISFDAAGNAIEDHRFVIEYDDAGREKMVLEYDSLILAREVHYAPCADPAHGESYQRLCIIYNHDGSRIAYERDEYRALKTTRYDANGEIETEERYEQERDADGKLTKFLVYTNDLLSSETIYMIADQYDGLPEKRIHYDANGEAEMECRYEYDDALNLLREVYYSYGVLNKEFHYAQNSNGVFYICKEVYYRDSGVVKQEIYYSLDAFNSFYVSKQVEYNEEGQIVSETNYDSTGKKIDN